MLIELLWCLGIAAVLIIAAGDVVAELWRRARQ